jgi:cell wall-associated NlpC family hydrolase
VPPVRNPFESLVSQRVSPLLATPSPLAPTAPASLPMPDFSKMLGGALPRAPLQPQPAVAPSAPSPADGWVSGVVRAAREAGVDPNLAVAIALEESGGNPRAVGDQGSSYGLFQLHRGGALGNLTPQQAYDPYTNAGTVLRAWGKLGAGKGMDPRSAFMDYYSRVGRGSSNEIPTQNALAKLAQARQLVSGAPAGAGGQTLAGRTTGPLPTGGGLSPQAMSSLVKFAQESTARALRGEIPDSTELMKLAQTFMQPTREVASGKAPPTAPPVTGRQNVATQAALQELGIPYSWGGGGVGGPTLGIQQGATIKGFDCSSLVQFAWAKAGVTLPRTSQQQMKVGQPVPNLNQAVAGDLLFPHPGHVMLYIGNGQAVESPHTGDVVHVVSVAGRSFQAIRRPG